jgi:hypothetical protein
MSAAATTPKRARPTPRAAGAGAPSEAPRAGLGEVFIEDLLADWRQHGRHVIEAIRTENPAVYLRVVGSVAPREVVLSGAPFDGLSNEELKHIAGVLEKALADPSERVSELLARIEFKPKAGEGA